MALRDTPHNEPTTLVALPRVSASSVDDLEAFVSTSLFCGIGLRAALSRRILACRPQGGDMPPIAHMA
jgi:hypothetical protein